ncbi:MAG: cysteine desulfurase [Muribaculaceae bacterium]|nr:cysteine desulfurase [Muribaculaceae bacterium]
MDIFKIRSLFPILDEKVHGKKPLIYLDNAATSQTPTPVVEAIESAYFHRKANVHRGVHCLSQMATTAMETGRDAVRRFIGASSSSEIIFTRGTTEALNLVASSFGELLYPGDLVILTQMEHHSNIVPWQLLQARRGIRIKVVPVLDDGTLDMEVYARLLEESPRIVSVTQISNVLGTVNPIRRMAEMAHDAGAVFVCDGAQGVAHEQVDVEALGVDFYAFSAHKMYGPTGIGALYGKRELLEKMPPYQGGGEMIGHVSFDHGTTWADLPYKFEAGTPDFVGAAAIASAIDFMENTAGIEAMKAHEDALLQYATDKMKEAIPDIRIYGTAPDKASLISFLIPGAHHYDTGVLLDQLGIAVRTGHHCAQPLMERFGIEGTVRASFAVYNTFQEIDTFIQALVRVNSMLR